MDNTPETGTRGSTRTGPMAGRTFVLETSDADLRGGRGPRTAGGWGPVLSGAVTTFLIFAILSALLLAIAGSGADVIANNFAWWELVSALIAALIGGFVAGWLDPREAATGAIQGLAAFGLLIFAGLIVGVPTGASLFSGASGLTLQGTDVAANLQQVSGELWGTFAIFAGGALLAAMGGAAGGSSHRKREAAEREEEVHEIDVRDAETTARTTRR